MESLKNLLDVQVYKRKAEATQNKPRKINGPITIRTVREYEEDQRYEHNDKPR